MDTFIQTKSIFLVLAACSILAIAGSIWLLKRRNNLSRFKIIGLAAILLLAVNVFLFHTPFFFAISARLLDGRDIGWRQEDALKAESYRFSKNLAADFLAVGNSQTNAIYAAYAKTEKRLAVLSMAGLNPMDYLLYKNIIKSLCNGVIILTVSDFDLGYKPNLLGAKLAPPQNFDLPSVISLLRHVPDVTSSEIQDVVCANIIDAYRYQYIFRGYMDKVLGRNRAFPKENFTAAEMLGFMLRDLAKIDRKWFAINLLFLERFLTWADENALEVIIVLGHYHPKALTANMALHAEASNELSLLCKRFPNCSYFRNEQLYEFTESDYQDAFHVREDAGKRFAQRLMKAIGN